MTLEAGSALRVEQYAFLLEDLPLNRGVGSASRIAIVDTIVFDGSQRSKSPNG
jgi:hypothetical protein